MHNALPLDIGPMLVNHIVMILVEIVDIGCKIVFVTPPVGVHVCKWLSLLAKENLLNTRGNEIAPVMP